MEKRYPGLKEPTVRAEPECANSRRQVQGEWLSSFQSPPAEFRPVPFWGWNEVMRPEEVSEQIRLIQLGGWGGAFVHSRVGLVTPYLGEDWFAAVDATLETCARLGLLVWLYDEDKWPSGYSGGTVPLAEKRFRAKALIARAVGDTPPPDAEPVGAPSHGLQVYLWTAPLGDPWYNGTAAVDRGSKDAMAFFLQEAYQSYYDRYKQHYGSLIQAEFTDEPCMMFRIACPGGAVPTSERAFEKYEELYHESPLPDLHKLFDDSPGSETFRLNWHRTINVLFEENYSQQIGEWCSEHGINLTGHYMCEHGVFAQQNWGVKIMPNYRHQQIPGIDHLGRQIAERITAKQCQSVVNQFNKPRMLSELYGVAGGGLTFEDRKWIALQQICLGVNLLNPHISLYTMSGCRKRDFPQNIFYQQPWWHLNRLVDEPLSRLCVAMSQGQCRPDILVMHPQESAQALWQSRVKDFDQDLSHPFSGQDWNPLTVEGEKAVKELEAHFMACLDILLGQRRSFDLGDEWILRDDGHVQTTADGHARLTVGTVSYSVVILPTMETLAPSTFSLLQEFVSAGGHVLVCGSAPAKLDGAYSPELEAWMGRLPDVLLEGLPLALQDLQPAGVELRRMISGDSDLVWMQRRQLEDGSQLVLLVNLSRTETCQADLLVRGRWKAVIRLNEQTGSTEPVSFAESAPGVTLALKMSPCECRLYHLHPEPVAENVVLPRPESRVEDLPVFELHPEMVSRLDHNALTLDYVTWRKGDEDGSNGPVPVIQLQRALNQEAYHGPLSLCYSFQVGEDWLGGPVKLVIEHPEKAVIRVNGTERAYEGLPYWKDIRWLPIDISQQVKPGLNRIELEYGAFCHGDPTVVEPAEDRYGTEIESLYLVGNFSVSGEWTGDAPLQAAFTEWKVPPVDRDTLLSKSIRLQPPQPLTAGDVTVQGLPFYSGRILICVPLPSLDASVKEVFLEVEKLQGAVAEVLVDDTVVGHLVAQPFVLDLSSVLIGQSRKKLEIVVYSSMRNLLGPHHHAEGELIQVGPGHFESEEMLAMEQSYESLVQWSRGEWQPADWRDDYCMIRFGDLGRICLRMG